ncbi:MAG: efflux RND transporter periplasmic adaptor subunit [Planctomycetes bacterium]|nr:efflux RND transporter periplasmic adaptor subunit [Planctomycetota bacterium]
MKTIMLVVGLSVMGLYGIAVCFLPSRAVAQPGQNGGLTQQRSAELARRVSATVREFGRVESASSIELRSTLEKPTAILHIVPEGTRVKQGDLLVQLDDSALQNELNQRRIQVAQAEAALSQAEATLAAQERAAHSATDVAAGALVVAKLAQARFSGEGAEYQVQLLAATAAGSLAERKIVLAKKRLARIDKADLNAAEDVEFDLAEAEMEMRIAAAEKKLLETHVLKHKIAVLELATKKARINLDQARQDGESGVRQAKADLKGKKIALDIGQQERMRTEQQIDRCSIRAPAAGMVIHANVTSSRVGPFVIKPGTMVHPRQVIIRLPDMSRLQVKTSVSETRINRIHVGQVAKIRCDAFPDRMFTGTVTHINRHPEPSSWYDDGGKDYAVSVRIDKPTRDLRIGLSALVEIEVGERKD